MKLVQIEVLYNHVYPGKIKLRVSNEVLAIVGGKLRVPVKNRVWEEMFYHIM